ncbi:MAG: hypothetical protein LBC72_00225, partial [Spirochaetaceae bacterium]|nr:hypothetical protein [Spirochaetaceae bacterium]
MAKKLFLFAVLVLALTLAACDNNAADEDESGEEAPPQKTKTLTGIEITGLPDKTIYCIGESIDAAGLCVEKIYDDDSREPTDAYAVFGNTFTAG